MTYFLNSRSQTEEIAKKTINRFNALFNSDRMCNSYKDLHERLLHNKKIN